MEVQLVDCHTHLNFKDFNQDLVEVINRADAAGVLKMIVVGAKLESSSLAVALARQYPGVYAAVGIHPHHADKYPDLVDLEDKILRILKSYPAKIVAVGETGLDHYPYQGSAPTADQTGIDNRQRSLFRLQLKLASRYRLPLIIHCRQAWSDLWQEIRKYQQDASGAAAFPASGVFHCWSGSSSDLKKALNLGFYVSFAGNITFPKNRNLQKIAPKVPLAKLVLETDCPYLAPQEKRGQRCEPADLVHTAAFLAKLCGLTIDELAKETTKNATKLFGFAR